MDFDYPFFINKPFIFLTGISNNIIDPKYYNMFGSVCQVHIMTVNNLQY